MLIRIAKRIPHKQGSRKNCTTVVYANTRTEYIFYIPALVICKTLLPLNDAPSSRVNCDTSVIYDRLSDLYLILFTHIWFILLLPKLYK